MKFGDVVQWTSQSQGYQKVKRGVIVAIVPAGEEAELHIPDGLLTNGSFGMPRRQESYLVVVGKNSRVYWPRAKHLALST